MTVSDMDRALAFYTGVLPFETVSDREMSGRPSELLSGIFGARSRLVRLRLGSEEIELTEFLAPKGRAIPPDIRGNDRLFQHIAIVVSDMTKAYAALRAHGVEHASTGPAAPARLESERRWHQRVLLPRSRSALSRAHLVPGGQGPTAVAGDPGETVPGHSTTRQSSWTTPPRRCASIATRSACRWPARVKTTTSSRST